MTTRRRRTEPPEGMAPMLDQCRHCGDFFEPAESSLAGVCPACESERYSTCPECRQVRANREFITLEGGRTICRTCANTIARRCDECGRWHLIDEVGHITDRHGNHICERCQDGWSRCERCGEWVPDNETRESAGRRACFRCAADEAHEGVQSYYYKPRPVFHRADEEPLDGLLLGVEHMTRKGGSEMCVVVYKPAGQPMPGMSTLSACWAANRDGAGPPYCSDAESMAAKWAPVTS